MTIHLENEPRHVVPRWRNLTDTMMLGELRHPGHPKGHSPNLEDLHQLTIAQERWLASRDAERLREAASLAAEALGLALALGDTAAAQDAAAFLLEPTTPATEAVRRASRSVQSPGEAQLSLQGEASHALLSRTATQNLIAELKAQVRRSPHGALAWMELARQYAIIGQKDESRRAADIALALAPDNRYVLRSVARMHTLRADPEHAHALLLPAAKASSDPWLVASEMALAAEAGKKSSLRRQATRILSTWEHDPFQVSELASELGTAELAAGNDRRARKLLRLALQKPNENAAAQAEWLQPQLPGIVVGSQALLGTHTFEARAREAQRARRWNDAFEHAQLWLYDQPFSIEAASTASYLACVALQDYEGAIRVAGIGVAANPQSAGLNNNLAFALAMEGELERAAQHVATGRRFEHSPHEVVVLRATEGLVRFRQGLPQEGRSLYREAITYASVRRLDDMAGVASVHLALEELRVGTSDGPELGRQALEAAGTKLRRSELGSLITLLERELQRQPPSAE